MITVNVTCRNKAVVRGKGVRRRGLELKDNMCENLEKILGFNPSYAVEKKDKLGNRILCEVLKLEVRPTVLTNGVHLDCSKLVKDEKMTRKDSAKLHALLVLGRFVSSHVTGISCQNLES